MNDKGYQRMCVNCTHINLDLPRRASMFPEADQASNLDCNVGVRLSEPIGRVILGTALQNINHTQKPISSNGNKQATIEDTDHDELCPLERHSMRYMLSGLQLKRAWLHRVNTCRIKQRMEHSQNLWSHRFTTLSHDTYIIQSLL
jgi:hypothetical protein